MTDIQIRGVFERDVDLLLLEELSTSPAFLHHFLASCHLSGSTTLVAASRSVNTSNGESDLELQLEDGPRRIRVLVENKIDAVVQERQGERYTERAANYLATKVCDHACTVLVAPSSYRTPAGYDYRVNYEDVLRWLESCSLNAERAAFKKALIAAALDRDASGWTLIPHPGTTHFWLRYWEIASTTAPELGFRKPGPKPATSSFVRFRAAGLPQGLALIHKVPYGHVDLQFSGMAAREAEFTSSYFPSLEPGMTITKAGKSMVIRLEVPPIPLETPIDDAEPHFRTAIREALRLLRWCSRLGAT